MYTLRVELSIGGLFAITEKFTGTYQQTIKKLRQYPSFFTTGWSYDGEYVITESIRLDGDQYC